jgi:hypothetical protein
MSEYTQEQLVLGSKTSYFKTLTILGLSGGLLGGLVTTWAAENKTTGKALMGTAMGGLAVLVGYGLYLRTGGVDFWRNPLVPPDQPAMAGLARYR